MNYPTSKQLQQICPNSVVQEIHIPNYEIEFNFINNNNEQERFMQQHESELVADEIITIMFDNVILPTANMLSISPAKEHIEYKLSMTYWFHDWQNKQPLHQFILSLLQSSKHNRVDLQLEGSDREGYYLFANFRVRPELTLAKRIKQLNEQLESVIKGI